MFRNAQESLKILGELRDDLHDAGKWLALARAQVAPDAQAPILLKAVSTIPSSAELWTELVHQKSLCADRTGLYEILRDALSLFSTNVPLWQAMMAAFPSTDTFSAALQHIDGAQVWPQYLQFLVHGDTSSDDRLVGLRGYLASNSARLAEVVASLLSAGRADVAATLLLESTNTEFALWGPVINQNLRNCAFLEAAVARFCSISANDDSSSSNSSSSSSGSNSSYGSSSSSSSSSSAASSSLAPPPANKPVSLSPAGDKDAVLVPALARALVSDTRNGAAAFGAARTLLLRHLEHPSSVAAFCTLFAATTSLYEEQITAAMRCQGQGGWDTARLLTEYANVLRKRPLLLSNAAVAQCPNDVKLWLARADLWRDQPHLAAHAIETALATVSPLHATNGDMADLYIRYAALLAQNGTQPDQVCAPLEAALASESALAVATAGSEDAAARLYIALAEMQQQHCLSPSPPADRHLAENGTAPPTRAAQTMRAATARLPRNVKVWTHYLAVLAANRAPNLLEEFSRCCVARVVTMRMVLVVAQAFPAGSANQSAVFDRGVAAFPAALALHLWREYLAAASRSGLPALRELYGRAFAAYAHSKRGYEELALLYFAAERAQPRGSLLMVRKRLQPVLARTTRAAVWQAYVATFAGDAAGQRRAYEAAIERLDDADATAMALRMAEFEAGQGELERARALLAYAAQALPGTEAATRAWQRFELAYGAESAEESAQKIHFVPAVEMES